MYGWGGIVEFPASNYSSPITIYSSSIGYQFREQPTPIQGLAVDQAGNLYFTLATVSASFNGSLMELPADHSAVLTLISFTGTSGDSPGRTTYASLYLDSYGNLFGATGAGGPAGDGTLFELSADHSTFTELAAFAGSSGSTLGMLPGGLVADSNGDIFGTTQYGGQYNDGTIFELSADHVTLSTLVSFTGTTGAYIGASPAPNLLADSAGDLYGLTSGIGPGYTGTLFELEVDHTTFDDLLHFTTGGPPEALTLDAAGDLFVNSSGGSYSDGYLLELPASHTAQKTIFSFTGTTGSYLGIDPQGLINDGKGDLIGTTNSGGAYGEGTIFKVNIEAATASLIFASSPCNSVEGNIAQPTAIRVEIINSSGQPVAGDNDTIQLSVKGNGGFLHGTLSAVAVDGVATFSNVLAGAWSSIYTLIANDSSLSSITQAISNPFEVGSVVTTIAADTSAAQAYSSNGHSVLVTGSLSIAGATSAWTGTLDLTNNDADIISGTLATVTDQIRQGYDGGDWLGNGIISSTSAADGSHLSALGVIQNNQSGSALFTASNPFDGTTPGIGDILVKYTYYGDANLDGKVDGSDYSLIDNGYLNKLTSWYNGDFNYDGVVDGSDYTLIDNSFNRQGASLASLITSGSPSSSKTDATAPATPRVPVFSNMAVNSIATDDNDPKRHKSSVWDSIQESKT